MTTLADWHLVKGTLKLGIGTDHGGYGQKEMLKKALSAKNIQIVDFGPYSVNPQDDYPDFASRVARALLRKEIDCGILICRSGIGMSINANRFHGVRAALVETAEKARLSRSHNASNILVTGGDKMSDAEMLGIVDSWLAEKFSQEERHIRRLRKIEQNSYDDIAAIRGAIEAAAIITERHGRTRPELIASVFASVRFVRPIGSDQ